MGGHEADEYGEDAEAETEEDIDPEKLKGELEDLCRYADLAARIAHNAKGDALLPALKTAFARAEALGAPRKAVIFTESRETQTYYRTDHNQFLDEEIFRKL